MPDSYDNQQYRYYTVLLRDIIKELPPYAGEFFQGAEITTLVRTRYAYAIDIRTFLRYLVKETSLGEQVSDIREISLAQLDSLSTTDIEAYASYLSSYVDEDGAAVTNKASAKGRKLASIRAFYRYFAKRGSIINNAPSLIDMPKLRDRAIIRLEPNEIALLLDVVQSGEGLSDRQKQFHKMTEKRDLAILTLFLGTGIRISELVGIDIDDVNFISDEFTVMRKGGKQDILSFGTEVRKALLDYMLDREKMTAIPRDINALFLSLHHKRITTRSVENLVRKYAAIAAPNKRISPHKLRSTYGTQLYNETGDIYLVADVLGHKDVNTTKKHYAAISQDRRRLAARIVKLRDDEPEDGKINDVFGDVSNNHTAG